AVQTAANKNLKATVSFNPDLSLSLIRNFPNLSLGIDDLKIVGKDSFANDTLINAPHLNLVVDLASVFGGGEIVIRKIHLQDARANIIFLKSGAANFDIAMADTTATEKPTTDTSAPMSLSIKELNIENTRIHYIDHSMDFELTTEGTNLLSQGDFADALFTLNNKIGIDRASMSFGGMTLLSKAKISGETAIDMDLNQMKFGFADNQFQINDLPLIAKGWIKMGEIDMDMDIDVRTPNSDFKSFLSVVPGCYTENFADVKASGTMGLVFTMKGIMNDLRMPATHVELKINDAGFQYPAMPANASNIQLNFALDNTDGNPDNTHVVIAPLSANLGGDQLAVSLDMKTPVSNPYANGKVDINLHLDRWKQLMPLESGTQVSGEVDAHFNFDGHFSAIAKEQFNDLKAGGNIALKNIAYTSAATLPLKLQQLDMSVSPTDFNITVNQLQYGKSAMNINGKLQNMLGYYLNDETLKGQLVINSNSMDLNEWMASMSDGATGDANETAAAQNAPATEASSAPRIPENLDLMFNMNVGRLL
ncbi:MAG: AsmA family protein, partial [Bacteroidia bacterium]